MEVVQFQLVLLVPLRLFHLLWCFLAIRVYRHHFFKVALIKTFQVSLHQNYHHSLFVLL